MKGVIEFNLNNDRNIIPKNILILYADYMDTEEYRKKIELKILQIIEDKLKAHQMNAERAREIAKYILASLHPHMDINQIHEIVKRFDKHFPELVPVVLQVSNDYEEIIKKAVTEHVGKLLKQNKITEATDLLQKAAKQEVKIK